MHSQSILATLLFCLSAGAGIAGVLARATPQRQNQGQIMRRDPHLLARALDIPPEEVPRLNQLTPLQRFKEIFPGQVSAEQLANDNSGQVFAGLLPGADAIVEDESGSSTSDNEIDD